MAEQRTHLGINAELVGAVERIGEGEATLRLVATQVMAADDRGLVHGGFTFGLADYAAMCAVNDPNVVLGGASCKFLAPVTVGQEMVAHARIEGEKGKKRSVSTWVEVEGKRVFEGELACFVLDAHVLD